jgi:putative hydrolase of the HAD superfamily
MGVISDEELWIWVGQRLGLTPEALAAFRRDFWAGDFLDTQLVEFIRDLRPRYQTAVISNATDNLRRSLNSTYPIADAFDLIVCSAEEKVMKPNLDIYLRALTRLGRQASEAVFIDDAVPNVRAAQEVGMAAIHFTPKMNLPKVLADFGVEQV